jgi:hypothetical protein
MKKAHKKVQQNPLTFQDWWDKQDYPVECFKPCRAAWNAAKGQTPAGVPVSKEKSCE